MVETSLVGIWTTSEWVPHDYVRRAGQALRASLHPATPGCRHRQTALEINLLTDDNLPYYHLACGHVRR